MAGLKPVGNDDIERLTDSLPDPESENPCCTGVPEANNAIAVADYDCVRRGAQNGICHTCAQGCSSGVIDLFTFVGFIGHGRHRVYFCCVERLRGFWFGCAGADSLDPARHSANVY